MLKRLVGPDAESLGPDERAVGRALELRDDADAFAAGGNLAVEDQPPRRSRIDSAFAIDAQASDEAALRPDRHELLPSEPVRDRIGQPDAERGVALLHREWRHADERGAGRHSGSRASGDARDGQAGHTNNQRAGNQQADGRSSKAPTHATRNHCRYGRFSHGQRLSRRHAFHRRNEPIAAAGQRLDVAR